MYLFFAILLLSQFHISLTVNPISGTAKSQTGSVSPKQAGAAASKVAAPAQRSAPARNPGAASGSNQNKGQSPVQNQQGARKQQNPPNLSSRPSKVGSSGQTQNQAQPPSSSKINKSSAPNSDSLKKSGIASNLDKANALGAASNPRQAGKPVPAKNQPATQSQSPVKNEPPNQNESPNKKEPGAQNKSPNNNGKVSTPTTLKSGASSSSNANTPPPAPSPPSAPKPGNQPSPPVLSGEDNASIRNSDIREIPDAQNPVDIPQGPLPSLHKPPVQPQYVNQNSNIREQPTIVRVPDYSALIQKLFETINDSKSNKEEVDAANKKVIKLQKEFEEYKASQKSKPASRPLLGLLSHNNFDSDDSNDDDFLRRAMPHGRQFAQPDASKEAADAARAEHEEKQRKKEEERRLASEKKLKEEELRKKKNKQLKLAALIGIPILIIFFMTVYSLLSGENPMTLITGGKSGLNSKHVVVIVLIVLTIAGTWAYIQMSDDSALSDKIIGKHKKRKRKKGGKGNLSRLSRASAVGSTSKASTASRISRTSRTSTASCVADDKKKWEKYMKKKNKKGSTISNAGSAFSSAVSIGPLSKASLMASSMVSNKASSVVSSVATPGVSKATSKL